MYQHESKQPPHKNLVFRQQNTKIFLKLPTLVEELAKTIKIWSQFHIFVKTTSKISSILREKRLIFYPNFLGTRRSFLVIFGQVHAEFSLRHWLLIRRSLNVSISRNRSATAIGWSNDQERLYKSPA